MLSASLPRHAQPISFMLFWSEHRAIWEHRKGPAKPLLVIMEAVPEEETSKQWWEAIAEVFINISSILKVSTKFFPFYV